MRMGDATQRTGRPDDFWDDAECIDDLSPTTDDSWPGRRRSRSTHHFPKLKERVVELARRPFLRNVAVVLSGTIVAQGVNLAFAPLLTRIFSPTAFGALGVFNFIVSVLGPLAAMSYPIAIVLADSDDDARALVWLSIGVSVATSVGVGCVVVLFGQQAAALLQIELIAPFLVLLPLAVLSTGLMQTAQQWGLRKEEFRAVARATSIHSALVNLSKLGLGLLQPVAAMLIVVGAFAPAMLAALIAIVVRRPSLPTMPSSNAGGQIRALVSAIRRLALAYHRFPLFRTPQSVINAVGMGIPIVILIHFDGAAAAGQYTLAMQVLMLPSLLLGTAVANVFYPSFAEAARNAGEPEKLLRSATGAMAALGALPHGVVVLFGPWLFELVFGHEWRQGGEFAQWLSVWLFFWFCSRPCMNAIAVLRLERSLLFWEIANTLLRTSALIAGFLAFSSSIAAILSFSIMGAALNLGLIGYVHSVTGRLAKRGSD